MATFRAASRTVNRLEIRRARLLVFGDPLPHLSYNLQADAAHAIRSGCFVSLRQACVGGMDSGQR